MTSNQGGPGNEPKPVGDGSAINISQSNTANIMTCGSLLMALQVVFKFAVFPDRMKLDAPAPASRLEFLLEEALREIKNTPAAGCSEVDEADGKRTALALVDQVAIAIGREIDSAHRS